MCIKNITSPRNLNLKGVLILCILSFYLITFGQDKNNSLDQLLELSIEELLNIKVSTPSKQEELQFDAPAVITVITANEIELFGAENLYEVMDWVVSTYVTGTYALPQNTISMRGDLRDHYDNHVLKLINGRPIRNSNNEGLNSPLYLSLPISSIQRIEIIRGAGSVLYGTGAYTGIINVITNEVQEDNFNISAGAGSFNTKRAEFSGGLNRKGFQLGLAGKFHIEDGWNLGMIDELGLSGSMPMSEDNMGGLLTAAYKGFTLTSYYLKSDQRAFVMKPDWSAPEEYVNVNKTFADLGYEYEFGPIWKIILNATYNRAYAERGNGYGESNDIIGEMLNKFTWEKVLVRIGAEVNYLNGIADVIPSYSKTWVRFYGDADLKLFSFLKLTGGGQINVINRNQVYFSPRAGIVSNFKNKYGLKVLYSNGFRSPTALETDIKLPSLSGNPILHPETVNSMDVQVFYNNKIIQTDLCWYYAKQSDLIQRVPSMEGPGFTFDNIEEGRFTGLEFNSKLTISNSFYCAGNATYQMNENQDGIENFTTVPNWMIKLGAAFQNPYFSLAVNTNYISEATDVSVKNPSVNQFNPEAKAFVLLNANMNLDLSRIFKIANVKELMLKINVQNLLDEKIYQAEFVRSIVNTIPMRSGRAVYVKISLSF